MAGWIDVARDLIGREGAVVRASLVGVRGSAPREAGAMMLISRTSIWQTIGGGTLEFEIMAGARDLIAAPDAPWRRKVITAALGPDMGQCCGGQVRVLLERFGGAEDATLAALQTCNVLAHPLSGDGPLTDGGDAVPGRDGDVFVAPVTLPGRPLFLYGAGHIGRALAPHLVALQFDLHWVDIAEDRFPDTVPAGARRVVATDPTVIAAHAPGDAFHLVITHNHALDEAICHRVLSGDGFARLGLIGSATKAARFRSRLGRAGVDDAALDRLVCPVGLPEITGKHPARVALSIAAGTAVWQQELDENG
ncbi:MAG: xanthine dehydrogenase accessory protein XdhC [Pseudomonadota bacterium]|nr:xanthine dehydrogenase accessory protein XdhC [Pseudomonadota bacterium]MEC8807088.1 xanthine dehydrogenase accessory protein XdhC [Pseudomonadota bacterium]MED5314201.1 xanthine dehydrogenase accessory protein XdhC [Pseudomonadota bacterium]MEE3024379.1 xanthine dehydrogenase accessory protein XdhC [Pseudomonadota bacterium]